MKNPLATYWNRTYRQYYLPAGFILLFAIIGVALLLFSHAAPPFSSIEAETHATSPVTTTNDTNASGGQYIQLGTANTPPPPPGSGCISGGVVAPCVGSSTTGASGWG